MHFCITPIPSIFILSHHISFLRYGSHNCKLYNIKKKKKHSQVRIFETALEENSIRAKVEDNEKFLYSSINGSKTHQATSDICTYNIYQLIFIRKKKTTNFIRNGIHFCSLSDVCF